MATISAPNGSAVAFFRSHVMLETDQCIIWPYSTDRNGYGQVRLDGRTNYVHILACIAWHGVRPEGMLAAHGPCHNPRCFNGAHLSWETHPENQRDRVRDQTSPRGEGHANAKLTEDVVLAIRARRVEGISVSKLAEEFDVTRGTANNIVYRRSWTHI